MCRSGRDWRAGPAGVRQSRWVERNCCRYFHVMSITDLEGGESGGRAAESEVCGFIPTFSESKPHGLRIWRRQLLLLLVFAHFIRRMSSNPPRGPRFPPSRVGRIPPAGLQESSLPNPAGQLHRHCLSTDTVKPSGASQTSPLVAYPDRSFFLGHSSWGIDRCTLNTVSVRAHGTPAAARLGGKSQAGPRAFREVTGCRNRGVCCTEPVRVRPAGSGRREWTCRQVHAPAVR